MKVVIWLAAAVILAIVALGGYVLLNSGSIIRTLVESLGSEYLGVEVSLDAAELSLTEGSGELRGLKIGNPRGFDGPHAMSLDRIRLVVDPGELSEELIVVKTIEVEAANVAIVAKGTQTNLQAIMENLDSGPDAEPAEELPADTGTATRIIIDAFDFTKAQTSLDSDLLGSRSVTIPDVHLTGVGRKSQGVTIREALRQLLRPVVEGSVEALAKEGLNLDDVQADVEKKMDEKIKEATGEGLEDLRKRFN